MYYFLGLLFLIQQFDVHIWVHLFYALLIHTLNIKNISKNVEFRFQSI